MKFQPTIHSLALAATVAFSSISRAADDAKPAADADNSKKNERDRAGQTVTPVDQSNAPEDLKITRTIRQAVVKDKSLTMNAKNVKIITSGGKVTLRGPVNSDKEKKAIGDIATKTAGEGKVDNQLEVKATDTKTK